MYLTYPITEDFPPRFQVLEFIIESQIYLWRLNGSHQLYDILKHVYSESELWTILKKPYDDCSGDMPEILISKFGMSLNFIIGKEHSGMKVFHL